MRIRFRFLLPPLLLGLGLIGSLHGKPRAPETEIVLLYHGDTLGEIEPCGCMGQNNGGLARRATLIRKYREAHSNLCIIEGGNWALGGKAESEKSKSLFLARAMGDLGYDVVNVGHTDLSFGLETLKRTAKSTGFTLVSANLRRKSTGRLVIDPYVIRDFQGTKVAFLGVMADDRRYVEPNLDAFFVTNAGETLEELVPKLRRKAALVVVCMRLGRERSLALVNHVQGIDVAILGDEPGVSEQPVVIGREDGSQSLVCAAGARGAHIGALSLVVSDKGKLLRWNHEMHLLDHDVPEDSTMRVMVSTFKEELRKMENRERNHEAPISP